MATVQATFDSALLTMTVEGELTSDDILRAIFLEYRRFHGKYILWELSLARTQHLSPDDFEHIALVTRSMARRQTGYRTAFVVKDNATKSQIESYIGQATTIGVQAEYRVFRDFAEAKRWLLGAEAPP